MADEVLLNTVISEFKAYDNSKQIAERIKLKYGKPQWDISIVLKNENGYRTITTPIVNTQNEVTAMILFYQRSPTIFDFKIIDRKTKQEHLPDYGNKAATIFTKASLLGLFQVSDKNFKNLKFPTDNNQQVLSSTATLSTISFVCWSYAYYHQRPDGVWEYTFSSTQCSYTLIVSPSVMPKTLEIEVGTTGGVNTNPTEASIASVDEIIDSITQPCVKALIDSIISKGGTAAISAILTETFGSTDKFNITFTHRYNMDTIFAQTQPPTINSAGGYDITIELNYQNSLLASNEFTTQALLHEIIHAYILANGTVGDNYTQHITMANEYIDKLSSTLRLIYHPNLSKRIADALAISGVAKDMQKRNTVESLSILNNLLSSHNLTLATMSSITNNYSHNGASGTHCN